MRPAAELRAARRWLFAFACGLSALAAGVIPPRETTRVEIGSVPFWPERVRARRFGAMDRLFPTRRVSAGGRARPLPGGRSLASELGGDGAVTAGMRRLHLTGLIVVQDGRVRLERYAPGHGRGERWTSFSIAKSITSTLVGAAIADGSVASLDTAVERYVPELAGSAYDGVTIRQLMNMSSGVGWNEDYRDPQSDVIRLFREPGESGTEPTIAYLRRLPRDAAPGTRWHYSTGDAELVGLILRRATGMPLADYLSRRIWRPFGMARDAAWQIDPQRREFGGCCLSATLRDYARFGLFMLEGGRIGGRPALPPGWIAEITRAPPFPGAETRYSLHWWPDGRGGYSALGIFGQLLHVDPARRLVIAATGNWPRATDDRLAALRRELIERIGRAAGRGT